VPPSDIDTIHCAITDELNSAGGDEVEVLGYTLVARVLNMSNGEIGYQRLSDMQKDSVAEMGAVDWGSMKIRRDVQRAIAASES
jgi:hypothetical protein